MGNPPLWSVRLKELRAGRGLSQTNLGKQCGLSQGQISLLENGKRKFTQITLDKLLKVLNADYERLFTKTRAPVDSVDYKKWNDDLQTIRELTNKLENQQKIIDYAHENCEIKTCKIRQLLKKKQAFFT